MIVVIHYYCGWLITAVDPISVIHIDGDDEVDDAGQLSDDESQQMNVIDDSTNDALVYCLSFSAVTTDLSVTANY